MIAERKQPDGFPFCIEPQLDPALNLTLPDDGTWVSFLLAGVRASIDGKDVAVSIVDASGAVLVSVDVMVRVRKNADELTDLERDRFLAALAELNGHRSSSGLTRVMENYADAHRLAFGFGIHGALSGPPLFLAWHRVYLLSLERELQLIDPRVTIPYWVFDEPSTRIFVREFMGTTPTGTTVVQFDATNPLLGWRVVQTGPTLIRNSDAASAVQDVDPLLVPLADLLGRTGIDHYGAPPISNNPGHGANSQLERFYHNAAHGAMSGWIGTRASPRDPMFFLLHANVDRAWAEWQLTFDRFDHTQTPSYSLQGVFPGGGSFRKGSYSLDTMWPWSRETGDATPDPQDDWPELFTPLIMQLPTGGNDVATDPITPASVIDYLNVLGTGAPIGACYDDIPFAR